ncbi:MAG: hypothetical protein LAN64_18580 [Acidobacteriia bacterium]|nr:hypothetical protein [Terriglobia bacterium]
MATTAVKPKKASEQKARAKMASFIDHVIEVIETTPRKRQSPFAVAAMQHLAV